VNYAKGKGYQYGELKIKAKKLTIVITNIINQKYKLNNSKNYHSNFFFFLIMAV